MSCSTSAPSTSSRVFLSLSRCIFSNLAFEEYLFRTGLYPRALLVWSNHPCVVFGRHQNPWVETHVAEIERRGIDLVRRHSGGGTVYHDLGNLNISFLTPHAEHCRPRNLRFIADTIRKRIGIQLECNSRDDVLLDGRKVSGTAARIARGRSYHHLTLLVDADREAMGSLLHSPYESVLTSHATRSVRAAAVGCLREALDDVNVDVVRSALIEGYRAQFEDCPMTTVDVDEQVETVPEIASIREELLSWEWRFAKTPRFSHLNLKVEHGIVTSADQPALIGQQFHHRFISL